MESAPLVPSPTFLSQVLTRKFFAFSGSTLLVYDYSLTLSLEVSYIWNAPWTIVKALFLFNRYGSLVGQIILTLEETGYLSHKSQNICKAFELFLPFYTVFSGESIRLLVVIRACAILRFKRSMTILACTLYILYSLSILVLSTYFTVKAGPFLRFVYLDKIGLCFSPLPPNIWMLWFMPLILDAFILGVVCFNLLRLTWWSDRHPSPLIRHLARDAFLFYFITLYNVLFEIVCWHIFRADPRNALGTSLSFPILFVVGQRLVLNLRRLRAQPETMYEASWDYRQCAAVQVRVDQTVGRRVEDGLEMDELALAD